MKAPAVQLYDRQFEVVSGVIVGIPSLYALTIRWEGASDPISLRYTDGTEREVTEETTTIHTLLPHPSTVKIGGGVTLWRDDPRAP